MVKILKLKVLLGLFFWLMIGLSGSQTYAFSHEVFSCKEFQEKEFKESVFPNSIYFEQVKINNLTNASQNELPALPSLFLPGNLLNFHHANRSFTTDSLYFQDLRYTLKIKIFPFHFFW